jgi:hypothetical protein
MFRHYRVIFRHLVFITSPSYISVSIAAVVVVLVVGLISTTAVKAYCTLTPMEFRHSSPEALHTKRRERPLLAKDGTKAQEI